MENAKNSFYIALRNRLARVNPARSIFLRGVSRPGVVVEENELVTTKPLNDMYRLRWTKLSVNRGMPAAMTQMTCEIRYSTAGTTNNGGMDRGQCLAAMDAELMQMLQPCSTQKMSFTQSGATTMATNVFWTAAVFEPASEVQGVLTRTVTVDVFSVQEVGEA
jgi:hypothetical protein